MNFVQPVTQSPAGRVSRRDFRRTEAELSPDQLDPVIGRNFSRISYTSPLTNFSLPAICPYLHLLAHYFPMVLHKATNMKEHLTIVIKLGKARLVQLRTGKFFTQG